MNGNDPVHEASLHLGIGTKALFTLAAVEHPRQFTNPDQIGQGWWRQWRDAPLHFLAHNPYMAGYCKSINKQHGRLAVA